MDHHHDHTANVVAHRGYALHHPENTLPALAAAVEAGARWIEFDVQLTADGIPVLIHDADLRRTGGVEAEVASLTWAELRRHPVNETARLGDRYTDVTIPTLTEAMALLERTPGVTALVELKRASLNRHGHQEVVDRVMRVLTGRSLRWVVISFSRQAVELARVAGASEIGWVIEHYTEETRRDAGALDPEFLLANVTGLPQDEELLWPGRWQWIVYDVARGADARRYLRRGASLIETMAVGELLDELSSPPEPSDG